MNKSNNNSNNNNNNINNNDNNDIGVSVSGFQLVFLKKQRRNENCVKYL